MLCKLEEGDIPTKWEEGTGKKCKLKAGDPSLAAATPIALHHAMNRVMATQICHQTNKCLNKAEVYKPVSKNHLCHQFSEYTDVKVQTVHHWVTLTLGQTGQGSCGSL